MTTDDPKQEGACDDARVQEIIAELRDLDARREALTDELFAITQRNPRGTTDTEQT